MGDIIDAAREQQWFFPLSLEDLLPGNHPARFVCDFVDQLNCATLGIHMPGRTAPGGTAYSPKLLLKVWLYCWLNRVRSPRNIERMAKSDVAVLWLTGFNAPDHNTIWRFWNRNKAAMKKLFRQTIVVSVNLGLVALAVHAVDGTKIYPASSRRGALHKEDLERLLSLLDEQLKQLEKEIAEDALFACDQELPKELAEAKDRRTKIAQQLKELAEHDKKRMLSAEPEVNMIKADGRTEFNYNAQAVVDSAHQIIVAEDVTTDVNDKQQLMPMIRQSQENLGNKSAEHILADGGYCSQTQIAVASEAGLEVSIPVVTKGALEKLLHSLNFKHAPEHDALICPATGQKLAYCKMKKATKDHCEARVYRCPVSKQCPLRGACFEGTHGKEIEVTANRPAVMQQVEKHLDGRMKEAMKKRLAVVEPVFALIKQHLDFRRFSVRSLENVQCQWSLVCTVANLSSMIREWQKGLAAKEKSRLLQTISAAA